MDGLCTQCHKSQIYIYLFDIVQGPWVGCHLTDHASYHHRSVCVSIQCEELLETQLTGTPSLHLYMYPLAILNEKHLKSDIHNYLCRLRHLEICGQIERANLSIPFLYDVVLSDK